MSRAPSVEGESMVIAGGILLDCERGSGERADLRVRGNRIVEIAPSIEPIGAEDVLDATDKLITPGLVNGHVHSAEALVRGRYENLPLEIWALYAYPMSPSPRVSTELIYLRTMLVALESLKNGVTTVVDDGPETAMCDLEALGSIYFAYRDAGIRATCSGAVIDREMSEAMPGSDPMPAPAPASEVQMPSVEQYVAFSEEAIERFHDSEGGRLRYLISPIAPQWCTDEMLQAAAALSAKHSIRLHTHMLETRTQLETAKKLYGKSIPSHLRDLGVLTELTTIAHSIWITEEDLELIAAAGASVVHNPVSNLKLGAGVAPLRALLDAGVNVGLGTDGIASNDSARIFDVMRMAALIHNVGVTDYERWPTAAEVLRAATVGGARSAGLEDLGRIDVGQKADLVVLDLKTLPFTPRNDLLKHLIYSENGSSITTVIVDGRRVVEKGEVTTVDEAAIIDQVNALFPEFVREQAEAERVHRDFEPPFADRVKPSLRDGMVRVLP